jgi:hypothetical protein
MSDDPDAMCSPGTPRMRHRLARWRRAACIAGLLWSGFAPAADEPPLQIGGLLFGDVYHVPEHHTEAGDGATGAVLRRGYFTVDARFPSRWFGRLRFELNQDGEFESYGFESRVKDLHIGWRRGGHRLVAGLSPTLTYDMIESIWGARYLLRTPLDLQGIASRDTGFTASGPLTQDGTLTYRAMLGTRTELGADTSDSMKWMGAVTWQPAGQWVVDAYADYEDTRGSADRATLQAFLAYRTEALRWGLQYSNQHRQRSGDLELASAFVVGQLADKVSLIGRVDRLFEPSTKGDDISYLPFDPSAKATFLIAGLEFQPAPRLTVTPNTIVTVYDRNPQGIRPETDWYLRLTAFLNFE